MFVITVLACELLYFFLISDWFVIDHLPKIKDWNGKNILALYCVLRITVNCWILNSLNLLTKSSWCKSCLVAGGLMLAGKNETTLSCILRWLRELGRDQIQWSCSKSMSCVCNSTPHLYLFWKLELIILGW